MYLPRWARPLPSQAHRPTQVGWELPSGAEDRPPPRPSANCFHSSSQSPAILFWLHVSSVAWIFKLFYILQYCWPYSCHLSLKSMHLLSDSLAPFPGFLHSLPFSQFALISQKSLMLTVCCETSSEQSSWYQMKWLLKATFLLELNSFWSWNPTLL